MERLTIGVGPRRLLHRVVAVQIAAVLACADVTDPDTPPAPPAPPETPAPPAGPPVYAVSLPDGKLPWPHHNPAWDTATYQAKLDSLWVINNFGAYTGTSDRSVLYLHDAWDLVLPNGTPIYAIAAGTVRTEYGGSQYYRTLIIEDSISPGFAWGYTHIYDFKVRPGDRVHQGTLLGSVNFQGLEHIHLARYELRPGGSWGRQDGVYVRHPDRHFVFRDTEPPVFEGRFRYVRNGSDSAFIAEPGEDPVVSGDVDIIVGLRDAGEWTRSKTAFGGIPAGYGDSHAVSRIEYRIQGAGAQVEAVAFDLERVLLTRETPEDRAAQLLTVFQHYESAVPRPSTGSAGGRFGLYAITNSSGAEPDAPRRLGASDYARSWRTGELLEDGSRRFPNGEYVVTVHAWDSSGNKSTREDRVRVQN